MPLRPRWPTLLGSYWEWVWGPVGTARPGVGYMHRPASFPLVQFAPAEGAPLCRNLEFPGRHVAKPLQLPRSPYISLHLPISPDISQVGTWPSRCTSRRRRMPAWLGLGLGLGLGLASPNPNQAAYARLHGGRFSTQVAPLLNASLCGLCPVLYPEGRASRGAGDCA